MREHKYKVWDKHKKVFIPTDVWAIVQTGFNAFGIMLKDWEDYKEGEYFYKDSQELIQFTGLRDRNGREIYEGDILKTHDEIVKVYFNEAMACFDIEYLCGDTEALVQPMGEWDANHNEIIGNIHENPDLL